MNKKKGVKWIDVGKEVWMLPVGSRQKIIVVWTKFMNVRWVTEDEWNMYFVYKINRMADRLLVLEKSWGHAKKKSRWGLWDG